MFESERYKTLPRGVRRQAIEEGWRDFKVAGWNAEPRYDNRDPRWHLWMNGAEAADRDRRTCAESVGRVEGWA